MQLSDAGDARGLRRATAALAVAAAASAIAPGAAQAAEALYGVTNDNRLVQFNSDGPRNVRSTVTISGLAPNEKVLAIDVRPANDQLYALGSSNQIYTVDPTTGTTRPIAPTLFLPALAGTAFGFDFNPTSDRIRVVSDQEQNVRHNPDDGTTAADPPLAYAAGDRAAGANPQVVGSAYTNSAPGAASTQLFGIDSGRDSLVIQNPSDGTLNTVGDLGADAGDGLGFDVAVNGTAYAAFAEGDSNRTRLYTINLADGTATPLPRNRIGINTPLVGLAAAGEVADDGDPPNVLVAVHRSQSKRSLLRRGAAEVDAAADEAATYSARISIGGVVVGSRSRSLPDAGIAALNVRLSKAGRRLLRQDGTQRLRLRVLVRDAAGNFQAKRRTIYAR
jgi:hypothetical protein